MNKNALECAVCGVRCAVLVAASAALPLVASEGLKDKMPFRLGVAIDKRVYEGAGQMVGSSDGRMVGSSDGRMVGSSDGQAIRPSDHQTIRPSDDKTIRPSNYPTIVTTHFNAITAENEMKPCSLQPKEGVFRWGTADRFVAFGEVHGMKIIGHCLVWHSQTPGWFFKNADGTKADRDTLIRRMREHIFAVVGRYRGRVHGWDVVNEAVLEDGSLRPSPWLEGIGPDYIELAFRFAHEADPDAELYYNDFNTDRKAKRARIVELVRDLKAKGVRIDAVGMQSHCNLKHPRLSEYEASLAAFAAEGVKVMVTELDVSVLPAAWNLNADIAARHDYDEKYNPWKDGVLPDEMQQKLARRYEDLFRIYLRHADAIDRVTVWGVSDGDSWLNDFPVKGRTDYPLLFDRALRPKPCAEAIARLAETWDTPPDAPAATFRAFRYEGRDALAPCDPTTQYRNPVMGGMAPDPSLTRKGEWFYLAQSSFSYFPGIPVWRSRNLVDWEFVSYAASRPSQLGFRPGIGLSEGVFAPDIKYNPYNDTFYLLVTVVGGLGNVLYKTKDPAAGWSEPIRLGFAGIDPGIFFEDAKTAYIVNNDDAPGNAPEYPGHRTIRCRPYDLETDTCHNEQEVILVNKGIRPEDKPIWCEGPHLYKVRSEELAVSSCFDNGKQANASQKTTNSSLLTPNYYLMTAEGGTAEGHSEVIWKGKSPMGPFTPCKVNPILTQRDLPKNRPNPVTAAGHADIIEGPDGDWWAVFLGISPYRANGRTYANTGRNTYLLPVTWIGAGDDRQPLILEAGREIPRVAPRTGVTARPDGSGEIANVSGNVRYADDFASPTLDPQWFSLRAPARWAASGADGAAGLRLAARTARLDGTGSPSYLCRWVRNGRFAASVTVDFAARPEGDFAGLAYYQNERHHYRIGLTRLDDGRRAVVVRKRHCGEETTAGQAVLDEAQTAAALRIEAEDGIVRFAYSLDGGRAWTPLGGDEDATILSTDHAGGFVGTTIGLYATAGVRE